jgi:hypothetical protein
LIKASGTIDDAFNQKNATKDNKVNLNILEQGVNASINAFFDAAKKTKANQT